MDNPLSEGEKVCGVYLLNAHLFIYGHKSWCQFNLRGVLENSQTHEETDSKWKIFKIVWKNLKEYKIFFWTGEIDQPEMLLKYFSMNGTFDPLYFHK